MSWVGFLVYMMDMVNDNLVPLRRMAVFFFFLVFKDILKISHLASSKAQMNAAKSAGHLFLINTYHHPTWL